MGWKSGEETGMVSMMIWVSWVVRESEKNGPCSWVAWMVGT